VQAARTEPRNVMIVDLLRKTWAEVRIRQRARRGAVPARKPIVRA